MTSYIDQLTKNEVKVVALGLMNHGKSSLLNQLVGKTDNSIFAVAEQRTTCSAQSFKYKNCLYIDTPGLQAENNEVVLETIATADIYLFVHNLTQGELNQQEMDYLKFIASQQDLSSFLSSTIFVMSNAVSDAISKSEINTIINCIKQQLEQIFGTNNTYQILAVDSIAYAQGTELNSNELIKLSCIPLLKSKISNLRKNLKSHIERAKIAPIYNEVNEISKQIEQLKEIFKKRLEETEAEHQQLQEEYLTDLSEYQQLLRRHKALVNS